MNDVGYSLVCVFWGEGAGLSGRIFLVFFLFFFVLLLLCGFRKCRS